MSDREDKPTDRITTEQDVERAISKVQNQRHRDGGFLGEFKNNESRKQFFWVGAILAAGSYGYLAHIPDVIQDMHADFTLALIVFGLGFGIMLAYPVFRGVEDDS